MRNISNVSRDEVVNFLTNLQNIVQPHNFFSSSLVVVSEYFSSPNVSVPLGTKFIGKHVQKVFEEIK